jgi:type II secretory pathway component GspD/PulD (secretin)
MTERHFLGKRRHKVLFAALLGLCVLCNGSLWASDPGVASGGADHHRVFLLNHICPERAREFLSTLNLATASRMPGTNALLVTGCPDDLRKAAALLSLVDAHEDFQIKQLGPASSALGLPPSERIAAAVGSVCIGSFAQPPSEAGKAKAIIDTHNGFVWAVAPIFQLQDIALAVELGPQVLEQRKVASRQAPKPALPVPSEAAANRADSEKITLPDDMQTKLLETRLWAAELNPDRLVTPDSLTLPPRILDAERRPLALDLALGQATVPEPSVPVPAGADAAAERPAAPMALQPGQIVPAETDPAIRIAQAAGPGPLPPPAPDVNAYTPRLATEDDRIVDLNLPERLPVIQLLDLVGKYMNLDYVYDPAKITGEVTLKLNGNLRGSMRVRDLYLLLESVLKFQRLAMTRHKGNIVTIVPIDDALEADPVIVKPGEEPPEAGNVVATRVFELQYIDTTTAQALLDNMKLSVGVTPIPESKTLIVTAYAYRMARIEQLLQVVDRPGEPRKFRFRQLRYTMATNLAEKVKALAEQLESVAVTVGVEDPTAALQKLPGESEVAFRQRQARARATAQAAAAQRARTGATQEQAAAKPGVYLDADERTNRILMIGVKDQLDVVEDLVDTLDVEQADLRSMRLYRIRHVDADEVSRKLYELSIITKLPETSASSRLTGGPRTATSPTAAAQAAAAARAAAAVNAPTATMPTEITEEGPVGEPQVVVVESTNSLLVNATQEQHAQIETIISYVDSEMLENEIPYKIYPLENSSPDHLATVLQSLIQETTQNQDAEGKIQTTVTKRREDEIVIVPDPNTYSLIVYASKRNQTWISDLVQKLDKRRPQVLIDVTLVEITKTDAFNYDLNLIQSIPNLNYTSGLANTIVAGTTSSVTSDTILDKLAQSDRTQFADMQWDGDNFKAFYGDKHVNALLTAMQSKNYGRVLAKPKILVNDNEPGTIKTTDTTYVEKTSSIPVSSGGAGADTTLIQTATDYTPYEAGITLEITPHISEGNLLRLDIGLVRSDFLTTEDPKKPPNTTASELNTAVTVPDGSTIILGGLLKLNQTKGGKKVPILGDIPLVGGLFRGINNSDKQSKLYIFVKAEVIRPDLATGHAMEELERLSERNRLAFEQHEKEFQNHQDWPGLKPKPIQPERVLEAQ